MKIKTTIQIDKEDIFEESGLFVANVAEKINAKFAIKNRYKKYTENEVEEHLIENVLNAHCEITEILHKLCEECGIEVLD